MLHIITKSLFRSQSVATVLPVIANEDAVLLLGDGLYSAGHPLLRNQQNLHAIDEDRVSRGLAIEPGVCYIDYDAMVKLTESHNPTATWG